MMITTSSSLRNRVEQCRRLAQHIDDPSIRLAMLNQMRLMDQELPPEGVSNEVLATAAA